jgi:spore maturation protein CgeB
MKIAFVLMKYDYGVKERGYSYEYFNVFMPGEEAFGKENVKLFDFMSLCKTHGKNRMNEMLYEFIKNEKPAVTVFCLFKNEIAEETVLKLKGLTRTVCYFIDDPWRQSFARHWIEHFDFFSTPDFYMLKKYQSEGLKQVIYSPFGFNSSIYVKKDLPAKYDVSFVGGFSALRKWIFNLLAKEGITVNVFGRGWAGNKSWLSIDEMVNVFNQSKINLNLSNASSYDLNFLFYSLRSAQSLRNIIRTRKNREQVKGRHYEINGCGGFQLSYFVPGLNIAYEIDKEIAVFDNPYNLADHIKYFLKNDDHRLTITNAGYERSVKEHSARNYIENLCRTAYQGNLD